MTNTSRHRHLILGAISGSSLDGLDLAIISFEFSIQGQEPLIHDWAIEKAATISFPDALAARLRKAPGINGRDLCLLDADLGKWMGLEANDFLQASGMDRVELVCSHGHTVFHEPQHGMTCQIGNGAYIAEITSLPVINDLRYADIAAGGVGAPFAPLADLHLFPGYEFYLNLGGISNLTHMLGTGPLAWDVSGCNQLLNHLSHKLGLPYDKDGQIARSGKPDQDLLDMLNGLLPFRTDEAVALDNQQVVGLYFPVLEQSPAALEDQLNTCTRYIADQIQKTVNHLKRHYGVQRHTRLFATGGGALNGYLMELLKEKLAIEETELVIPEKEIVEFKEAALIALAGLFRKYKIPNSLQSVTFAQNPPVGGALHIPSK